VFAEIHIQGPFALASRIEDIVRAKVFNQPHGKITFKELFKRSPLPSVFFFFSLLPSRASVLSKFTPIRKTSIQMQLTRTCADHGPDRPKQGYTPSSFCRHNQRLLPAAMDLYSTIVTRSKAYSGLQWIYVVPL
jgi:hypothetical protein